MRIFDPAIVQVASFGASVLTGLTQSAPTFRLFFCMFVSADAGLHDRTNAAAIE
jgi:hypothetical protein